MEIKLDYHEVMQAVQEYLDDKHGVKIDVENNIDFPWIHTYEHSYGYTVDDEGKKVRDPAKDTTTEKQYQFGDGDSFSFYV